MCIDVLYVGVIEIINKTNNRIMLLNLNIHNKVHNSIFVSLCLSRCFTVLAKLFSIKLGKLVRHYFLSYIASNKISN